MIRRWLSQTLAVSLLSVRTIPQRASSSAVAMIGIAGVVRQHSQPFRWDAQVPGQAT